jgi:lysophospholipase L1-like esterase
MTTKKRIVFGLVAIAMTCGLLLAVLLGADLYLHRRAERYAAVNVWGYRGAMLPRKAPGEHRLVVLGGSTVLGYGVTPDRAFPAQLEEMLRPLSKQGAPVRVVNLGMNSQGAYAFKFDLQDYESLGYDAVVLYEGYNDLSGASNVYLGRRASPIFRLTGYYPVFPVMFREKAMALRYGGDISAGYREKKTVFRPGLASRVTAAALQAAADVSESLEGQLSRLDGAPGVTKDNRPKQTDAHGCPARWSHYCAAEYEAIRYALDRGRKILVVTQPYIAPEHEAQQAALRTMLDTEFRNVASVRYINLGPVFDLHGKDKALFYDGMHATEEGNRLIAAQLIAPVADLMSDAFNPSASSRPTAVATVTR